ncbi:MAG: uroporphyrinogen decarboxylase family protein, partial [Candidatus Thorarchaeota archaeon]
DQAMRHEAPQRTPVIPLVGLYSSACSGYPINDLLKDGNLQAKSQLAALQCFKYDGVFTCMDLTVEAEALGASITFPQADFPYVSGHPAESPGAVFDLEMLSIHDARLLIFVDSAKQLVDRVGWSHLVSTYIIGPFTLAGHLIGVESLLEHAIEDPELTMKVVNYCQDVLEPLVEAYITAGAHNVVILEPTASSSIISPKFFEKYSAPDLSRMVSRIHKGGIKATIHICGNTLPILHTMCDTKADALSIDSAVDLKKAKEVTKGRATLIGNVDTTLILTASKENVRKASRDCLEKAAQEGGFILSTGCDVPLETPEQNIHELVNAVIGDLAHH